MATAIKMDRCCYDAENTTIDSGTNCYNGTPSICSRPLHSNADCSNKQQKQRKRRRNRLSSSSSSSSVGVRVAKMKIWKVIMRHGGRSFKNQKQQQQNIQKKKKTRPSLLVLVKKKKTKTKKTDTSSLSKQKNNSIKKKCLRLVDNQLFWIIPKKKKRLSSTATVTTTLSSSSSTTTAPSSVSPSLNNGNNHSRILDIGEEWKNMLPNLLAAMDARSSAAGAGGEDIFATNNDDDIDDDNYFVDSDSDDGEQKDIDDDDDEGREILLETMNVSDFEIDISADADAADIILVNKFMKNRSSSKVSKTNTAPSQKTAHNILIQLLMNPSSNSLNMQFFAVFVLCILVILVFVMKHPLLIQ